MPLHMWLIVGGLLLLAFVVVGAAFVSGDRR